MPHVLAAGGLGMALGLASGGLAAHYTHAIAGGQHPDAATLLHALARAGRRVPGAGGSHLAGAAVLAIACMAAWLAYGWSPRFGIVTTMAFLLCCLALIDARTGLLPDALNIPLLLLGLAAAPAIGLVANTAAALLGALAGYLMPWLLARAYQAMRGTEGMGRGDFKLAAALGAWCGLAALPTVLLLASIGGVAFAMVHQRTLRPCGAYPFGPFLAAAGLIVLLAPEAGIVSAALDSTH
ncbi:hypothetical protein GSY71_17385 [Pusillimonas sp. TS35]|uniref:prepilin peptidase n=1 Tax=Paracandidimonas lactea TaxID=2895524 RepID=UPI00136C8B00|nr:A24 family peptidase [Paracandidimonas lactea]MYN14914.1 hypothetical protein [Pusillimonas sp. TS35]